MGPGVAGWYSESFEGVEGHSRVRSSPCALWRSGGGWSLLANKKNPRIRKDSGPIGGIGPSGVFQVTWFSWNWLMGALRLVG